MDVKPDVPLQSLVAVMDELEKVAVCDVLCGATTSILEVVTVLVELGTGCTFEVVFETAKSRLEALMEEACELESAVIVGTVWMTLLVKESVEVAKPLEDVDSLPPELEGLKLDVAEAELVPNVKVFMAGPVVEAEAKVLEVSTDVVPRPEVEEMLMLKSLPKLEEVSKLGVCELETVSGIDVVPGVEEVVEDRMSALVTTEA